MKFNPATYHPASQPMRDITIKWRNEIYLDRWLKKKIARGDFDIKRQAD